MNVLNIDDVIEDGLNITEEIIALIAPHMPAGGKKTSALLELRQQTFPLVTGYLSEHTDFYSASTSVLRKMIAGNFQSAFLFSKMDIENGGSFYRTTEDFNSFLQTIDYETKPVNREEVANVLIEHIKSALSYDGESRHSVPLASNTLSSAADFKNTRTFVDKAREIHHLLSISNIGKVPECMTAVQDTLDQARRYRASVIQFANQPLATPSLRKSP